MQLQVVWNIPWTLRVCQKSDCGRARAQVMLEFPMDDAASGEREDALVEMSFYVPKEADGFAGEGEDPSAKVGHALSRWDHRPHACTLCREAAAWKTTPPQRCSRRRGYASGKAM